MKVIGSIVDNGNQDAINDCNYITKIANICIYYVIFEPSLTILRYL